MHSNRAVILYQDWQEIDSFDIEKMAVPSSQFLRKSLSMSLWYWKAKNQWKKSLPFPKLLILHAAYASDIIPHGSLFGREKSWGEVKSSVTCWLCPCLCLAAYFCFLLTALGVTAGAHRLWSHRSYKAKLPLRIFLAAANSMAFQVGMEGPRSQGLGTDGSVGGDTDALPGQWTSSTPILGPSTRCLCPVFIFLWLSIL